MISCKLVAVSCIELDYLSPQVVLSMSPVVLYMLLFYLLFFYEIFSILVRDMQEKLRLNLDYIH
jgi:hypothetical protein